MTMIVRCTTCLKLSLLSTIAVTLSACGGGGTSGGSGPVVTAPPPPTPPVTFTSFSELPLNRSVEISGQSREGTVGVSDTRAHLENFSEPTVGNASVEVTISSGRLIDEISIDGRLSDVDFSSTEDSLFNLQIDGQDVAVLAVSPDLEDQALYANPDKLGFEYQSFGVWGEGLVLGQTANYGAISAGAVTQGSSIPTSGTATFTGVAGGIYTSRTANTFRYASLATFDVDFVNREIDMSTAGTVLVEINTENVQTTSILNITGTMTFAEGSPSFSGQLTASNGFFPLTGEGSGSFYGPEAQELGGTFFLTDGGIQNLVGGFGTASQ